jgi:hypothetical protein
MLLIFTTQLPTAAVGSTTVSVGAAVTLTATADGTNLSYQWRKNGAPIQGATAQTYSINSASSTDAAVYQVVASNAAGSAASPEETLIVGMTGTNGGTTSAPTIVTQPTATQTVLAGSNVTLAVVVDGAPTPTIMWKKDGVTISGATNASLTLNAVTTANSGTYVAVATNSAGTVMSNPAVVTITEANASGTAPTITEQPVATQTVLAGASATIKVVATGNPAPAFQWRKNGANIAGATSATLSFTSVSTIDAATYSVIVSNASGSLLSDTSILLVQSAPVITTQPTPIAAQVGTSGKFSVAVSALPGATLQWHKNGTPIAGATAAVLLFNSISSTDAGMYRVVATNPLGSATSDEVALVLAKPPTITLQPVSQTATAKANVSFVVEATGSPSPTYQWKKNGVAISGATAATLYLKGVNKPDAGEYMVEVRNAAGWVNSNRVGLTVNNQTGGRTTNEDDLTDPALTEPTVALEGLVNLSVRANAGTGSNGLIVGFVIDGVASKRVLIRGVGPTLRNFGVAGALADPQLALYSGTDVTASNDDWATSDNALQIAGISARVGAFTLADDASDSALMALLGTGAYTVQLSGKDSSSGVALVEVYDAASSTIAKLVNLSVRSYIGSGADVPSVGFVIAGAAPRRVMIRAVGPTLGGFGVGDAIADPQLELFRGVNRIDQNDNWGGDPALGAIFTQVGAFGFATANSKDAVLVRTLEPGAYTVVVSGVGSSQGIGLVEVYDVP